MAKSKNAGKGSVAQVQDKDERRKALDADRETVRSGRSHAFG